MPEGDAKAFACSIIATGKLGNSGMTSIGETLRRERLRLRLNLNQIAQATKIGTRLLEAMEANEFHKLPGGVFTRSFIRQYAHALGLDDDALGPELNSIEPAETANVVAADPAFQPDRGNIFDRMGRPSSGPDHSGSLVSALIWMVLAIGICSGAYYFLTRSHGAKPEKVQPRATSSAIPTTTVVPTPANTAPVPVAGKVQITLTALEPAWVSVKSDGKQTFTGMLQPNESKQIGAAEIIRLTAGNAGALQVSLNGRAVGPLGPKGQVRVVELTSGGVRDVPRTPPSPAPL
jgi:cytoskeletal protein RodZ